MSTNHRPMRVGVNLLNYGLVANGDTFVQWAQTAKALGYHGVFLSDHVAVTTPVANRYPEPFFDPFATLAWLAGQCPGIDLGTTVIVLPYRPALLAARLAANLDHLSGGRLIFGIGTGWDRDEFAALGVPHARRGALTDQCLEAILALWSGDGPISYRGNMVSFEGVSPMTPHQTPRPPIWVGGGLNEAALRRTARFGDAWHPILTSLDAVPASLQSIRRQARAIGRPEPDFAPRIPLDLRESRRGHGDPIFTGTVDQVRDDFIELQRLGASYVVLDWVSRGTEITASDNERRLQMAAVLAEHVLDLPRQTLR